MIEGYVIVREAAEKRNLHIKSVQQMCSEGRIPRIAKFGRAWAIPIDADPPEDGRCDIR